MTRQRLLLIVSAVASVTLWTYACGDGTTEPSPEMPRPTTVNVSPATADLAALGATVQLTAQVLDQNGQVMAGATVTWASSTAGVATVNASGLVTAVANGNATISATAGQASGSAAVTVAQVVSAVAVAPAEASFGALGDTLRLTAEAHDANGHVVAGAEFSWGSNDVAVATVAASGLVTAVANGSATITATAGEASGSATVTVAQVVSSVMVAPAEANFSALGDTLRLTAEAFDANGHVVAGAEFSWGSNDVAVATVAASGLVTAVANGAATIAATAGETSGSATVTVAQAVTSVRVVPAEASFAALGDTLRLTAEAIDANGSAVTGVEFSWESSDDGVATVDPIGLVTAIASGSVTITATSESASGSAMVTVAQEVSAVTVVPDTATVVEGDTLRFAATARDANGQVVTGAGFAWASADTTVAVVDATGLVAGVGIGLVQVTATVAGVTGSAELTVVAPVPTTIAVTPDTVVLTALGHTAQLTADVRDQAGRAMDGIPVAWLSADTTVAVVDSSGLVGAVRNGAVTVTATASEAAGEARVTVMQSAGSVAVSPPVDSVATGDTLRLVAEAYDENGHVVEGALFNWSSSDAAVATVDPSGLVRGAGEGTATIRATAGDASGTSEITVLNPDRAALVALYNATDGPNWVDNTNWLTDAPLGEWYGVSTDASGRVTLLDLGGAYSSNEAVSHGLNGPIPPELGGLSNLSSLNLSLNDLHGPIPPELGELANLRRLRLSDNALTGPIPPELGDLANLELLDLYRNALTGEIPPELGGLSTLYSLILSGNALTAEIPPELGGLSTLRSLILSFNALTGEIPPELGQLGNLQQLNFHGNSLSGPIPPELGGLVNLKNLWLGDNDLTGPIPPGFLEMVLQVFNVRDSGLCVPGTSVFVEWLDGLGYWSGPFCNTSDQAALTSLYELTAGAEWTETGGWLSGPALEEWHGLETDSLGRVTALALSDNGLAGLLPGSIADLGELRRLRIDGNELGGRLSLSLATLDLDEFHYHGTALCEPAEAAFREWLEGIPSRRGTSVQCAPLTDRDALVALYNATGGPNWAYNTNWLTDAPLDQWQGVTVNRQGRVVSLNLAGGNLSGAIPSELGALSSLRELSLNDNDLSGPIPPKLGNLANLEHLSLGRNDLSGAIPPELGHLANLRSLNLPFNTLSGAIPAELGGLSSLGYLSLSWNALSGEIPPELGHLANLHHLGLFSNDISGEIPPELGGLANLGSLALSRNDISGAIPPELGGLAKLGHLWLSENDLSGAIPPELGDLANLERMHLGQNRLSGPVPPTFGGLAGLIELELSHNPGLAGAMPEGMTSLELQVLLASGTDLCLPREPAFEEWLAAIPRGWIALCGEPPAAYLVQAVQSLVHLVPLVAGEAALLRAFVTAAQETTEGMPDVRARFYVNGTERHVADIAASSVPIPTEIDEGDLSKSANAEIPGWVVQPGLEMVVEVDPGGALDPGLGVPDRIPAEGRLVVEVREMPTLHLTVIPFLLSSDPDSTIIGLVDDMAADPEGGHALLELTHVLLPVGGLDVRAHVPVVITSINDLLIETEAIRVLEGGGGHYMGTMSGLGGGQAHLGGRSSFSAMDGRTIAHELGHNMSLSHAPCGGASGPDPSFPYPRGAIGAWGYDFRSDRAVPAARKDHMGYCQPLWTSDYHFVKALRHRLTDEGTAAAAPAATSLLLWGGADSAGAPYLSPVFVADAPPALPDSAGDWTLTGRDTSGRELFSLSFTMPVTADGDGSSSFAFMLPAQTTWAEYLASITLDGPTGTATLDGDSNIPMTILRDPVTGQVRAILRRSEEQAMATVGERGMEVLFSRGIPR